MSLRLFGKEIKVFPFGSRITRTELPEELIVEILLLLPVAALLRFRCVSKKWRNLIDSPDFIKSQLDHVNKAHSTMIFIGEPNSYRMDLDSVCNYTAPHPLLKLKELRNPCLGSISKSFGAVGPCYGLICTTTDDNSIFCLWNPSTGKKNYIPPLPLKQPPECLLWSWGLGYDCNSDDFKVVCIVMLKLPNDCFNFVIWIYSLKSGFWKSIGELPYFPTGQSQKGVFVNGALHWIVRQCKPYLIKMIVAFDLGKLECNILPLPEYKGEDYFGNQLHFGVLDGCLYVVYQDYGTYAFDLWVMKEYGVKESWTRLIACPSYTRLLKPLAYTETRDELIFAGQFPLHDNFDAIVRYEFEMEIFKEIFHPPMPNLPTPLVYIPSLVCPQSAGNSNMAL